jgi:hypothetical protein
MRKYADTRYDPSAVRRGWHGWRANLRPEMIKLPRQSELRTYFSDDQLDSSNPRTQHYLGESWSARDARR